MRPERTWVEISSEALAHNVSALRSCLEKEVKLIGVVKANAYGHGLAEVVRVLDREGVKSFGVDSIDEALAVRRILPSATVITLGFIPDERLGEIVDGNIESVLYDRDQVRMLNEEAGKRGKTARIHLKVETGTARQGVFPEDMPEMVRAITSAGHLTCVGMSTHFAAAENLAMESFTRMQVETFYRVVEESAKALPDLRDVHAACSAAILSHPQSHATAVRAGIALYGLWPSEDVEQRARKEHLSLQLRPVLSWFSRVAQVKDYPAGTSVGYGRTEVLNRPSRVAVVPVGYYDGYDRRFSRRAPVLVRGHRCKVLGTVCMNMMMVDVSRVPALSRGDRVTLIGQDGGQRVSAQELATVAGTIHWEIVTRISAHLPRRVI